MTDARDARTLARPLEVKPSSRPSSIRLLLARCACHGSCGYHIERVVKLIWQSSDAVSTERSGERSMDVTTSGEPDAFGGGDQTHHAHSGPLVPHGASNLAAVLTALSHMYHTFAGEACREPGLADIRANLFIVQRITDASAGR